MSLDPNREIYPNAQLKLVAFEFRYPPVPVFESDDGKEALYSTLRQELPILGPPPSYELEVAPGGTRQRVHGTRMLDRQRTRTVAVTEGAVTVETSAYSRYEEFAAFIEMALDAVNSVAEFPASQRVGLRYIDEISVPGAETVESWAEYIVPDLLAPAQFQGYETLDYRAGLRFAIDEAHAVAVRFGLVNVPLVDPTGPLRISKTPEGRYFMLDIDSAWSAPAGEFPEFALAEVMGRCEALHEPVRTVFERAITPKLRDEVLRKEPFDERHADR